MTQTKASSSSQCIIDVMNEFNRHLYELQVFGSSSESYLLYLKSSRVCPYELYEKHISYRWDEMIAQWNNLKEDHEVILLNLSDTFAIVSPIQHLFRDFWRFLNNLKSSYMNAMNVAFEQLRRLHLWICQLIHKLKYLNKIPAVEWPPEFFCPERHSVAHHSSLAVFRNHSNPTVVDVRIGSSARIRRRRKLFHIQFLQSLKNLIDSTYLKYELYDKPEADEAALKKLKGVTVSGEHEAVDYYKLPFTRDETNKEPSTLYKTPYIPFSVGSHTFLSSRFQSHNEAMSRRKKLEKFSEFDYSKVINLRKYLQQQIS